MILIGGKLVNVPSHKPPASQLVEIWEGGGVYIIDMLMALKRLKASPSLLCYFFKNCNFFSFFLFMATPAVYGSSWARGQFGDSAAGLYHSQSDSGS